MTETPPYRKDATKRTYVGTIGPVIIDGAKFLGCMYFSASSISGVKRPAGQFCHREHEHQGTN